jgi:glycosyltransferase involved in cell wall biosynthesis
MPEFVQEQCGRVVSPVTPDALAAGVTELLVNDDLRRECGRRAAQRVRQRHRIDTVAPRILDLMHRVARN